MYDAIGPRDGRQASSSRKDTKSANVYLAIRKRRENCHLLTTDDRNVHLNARPNNNVGVIARLILKSSR